MKTIHHKGLDLYKTTEKLTSENYPYGFRLKTTKTDWLEFNPKKGFRHVEQTINPKTGKANKEKKGVYYMVLLMGRNEANHVKTIALDFYGTDGINRDCETLFNCFDLFTAEQIKSIASDIFVKLFVEVKAKVIYTGSNFEKLKSIYDPFINIVKEIMVTGENKFDLIKLPLEEIKSLEIKDFNPFQVRNSVELSTI